MNPFKIAVLANLFVLGIYSLGWSSDYQTLSLEYISTVGIVNCANIVFGYLIAPFCKTNKRRNENSAFGFYLVLALFILDVLYTGTFPLLSVFIDSQAHYKDIQHIPTVYPIYIALNVLSTLIYFHSYRVSKNRNDAVKVFVLLLILLLGMGRGVFFVVVISLIFISMYTTTLVRERVFLILFKPKTVVFGLGLVVVFLVFGNIRPVTDSKMSDMEPDEIFTLIGNAMPEVKNNALKSSLFPLYLYLASPTGNMNKIVTHAKMGNESISGFLVHNFAPESAHQLLYTERELNRNYLVNDYFNVSTSLADAFLEFRYVGIVVFQLIMYFIFLVGLLCVTGTAYKTIYLSLFTAILVLSNFANMFIYDAFLIPLSIMILSAVTYKLTRAT
jgi:oligosaccharide repeat unit polymerase